MPRNRRHLDKEQKRRELVDVARELFVADGYHETTMVRVADAAGVAPNTIYWYFERKDTLLAAVLESLLASEMEVFMRRAARPLEDNLEWALDRLATWRPLALPMHELRNTSVAVAAVHDRFRSLVRTAAAAVLRDAGLCPDEADALTSIWQYVLEGLLLNAADDEERQRVVTYLLTLTRQAMSRPPNR